MPKKTSGRDVATHRLLSACALVLLLAAACSGPTSPTTPPPVAPTVPTPPSATAPPLSIACPANVATSTAGPTVAVAFNSPTTAGGVAPVTVSCTRQPGSIFTVGETTVQCTAIDAASASSSCTFTVTVTALVPRLTRTRFLAFGDSVTSGEITVPTSTGYPTHTGSRDGTPQFALIVVPSASYPTQLQSLLRARYTDQASAITVTNSGVPGEWAQDGAKRLPGVITAFRPEAVLLLEGSNDLGAVGTTGILAAALAIDTMAKEIRNRGARVFLATLPPPGPGGAKGIPASQVVALNDRIRATARGEGAVLVDVHAALATDVARYVGVDGLHLTELGYQRVAELFFTAIRADLEVR